MATLAREVQTGPSDATGTRRAVLRSSLGGFALAASGLFLPLAVDEAEAREGANGGKLGGRRGKDRRGRHRRRSHGEHKDTDKDRDKDKNAPGAFTRGVRWGVYSLSGTYEIEFWSERDFRWALIESRRISPDDLVEFKADWPRAVMWINGRYLVSGHNPIGTPFVVLGHGGSYAGGSWKGGKIAVDTPLREGEKAPPMEVDSIRFQAERLQDDDDFKRFHLDLTKR